MQKVQFQISAYTNKVSAIKAMRTATGLSLQEAKNLVDQFFEADAYSLHRPEKTMVMNMTQFGRLAALSLSSDHDTHYNFWDVKILDDVPSVLDVSTMVD